MIATLLSAFPYLLGGVGLFLVGMILMSDGLKAAAGRSLQAVLERSTGTTTSAFLSGVGLTALVQSSSATTITTIGFVSAGLLSFAAAIGVIIGANVGTTSTGWIVSLLGFKLNVSAIALPFIGVGALLRLLGKGRQAHVGMAVVGFGLIFIGIDFLQEGMGGLAQNIDLTGFSQATMSGRVGLTLIGVVMTVLLQSSSAAVALTLTALHSGAIGLEQAAYLVIGQNVGTTVTAVLASAGASIPARRTALAHILFNVITGLLAFMSAGALLALVRVLGRVLDADEPAMFIALFHTVFNLMGAILFLPFTAPFARLITRLIPDQGPVLTRHLDKSLQQLPDVAVEAAARALEEIVLVTLQAAAALLHNGQQGHHEQEQLAAAQAAMNETSRFLGQVRLPDHPSDIYNRRLSLLHAGDHVDRLIEACLEAERPVYGAEVRAAAKPLAELLQEVMGHWPPKGEAAPAMVQTLAQTSAQLAETRRHQRAFLLEKTAAGQVQPDEAQRQLESMRWVDRIGYHIWRTTHHLTSRPAVNEPLDTAVYEDPEPHPQPQPSSEPQPEPEPPAS
ncbi:MAG: Na/Pi cotransporter family protein [Anaerolineae bacterium]|nr:Na/Pi cotransporter family protein [Anaerolineae bacterium]